MFPLSSLKYSTVLLLSIYVGISSQQKSSRNKGYPCMIVCQCTNKTLPKKQDSNGTNLTTATFEGIRMKCDLSKSNFSDVKTLNKSLMMMMPKNLIELDLSANQITELSERIFYGLENLLRLNLSLNPIAKLSKDVFQGLKNLKILDLSHTEVSELKGGMFVGLRNLERLIFLETPIKLISNESLDELKSISRLDINSQLLTCDCHLQWFSDWLKNRSNVHEDILCGLPSELKGRRVSSLEPDILHCDWPLELSHFELIPSTNQVIFKGDSLPIACQATFYDSSMSFSWLHNNQSLDAKSQVNVKVVFSSEKTFKVSTLDLQNVDENSSGLWTCRIGSGEVYVSKSISIVVLHSEVTSCPPSKTFDNKGDYDWPRALAGAVKSLPCVASVDYSGIQHLEVMKAYRRCRKDGTWEDPDTSSCPYTSEVTRMLKEAASLNLSLPDVTTDNALKMFHSIGPQTSYGSSIRDHAEICFLAKIVEQLAVHSKKFEKVAGEVVVGLVNLSMNVPPNVLQQAQLMDGCCSRILKAMENTISNLLSSDSSHATFASKNVAIHGRKMTPKNAKGVKCDGESISGNQTVNVSLNCDETHLEINNNPQDHQSTIFIPSSTISSAIHEFNNNNKRYNFHNNSIREDDGDDDDAVVIIIINLRDSRLFPVVKITDGDESFNDSSKDDDDNDDDVGLISGPVLMASIVSNNLAFKSPLSPPSVVVTMKIPARKVTLTQVKWKELPDGRGKWTRGDCSQIIDGSKIQDGHDNDDIDDDDDDDEVCDDDDDDVNKRKHLMIKFSCQSLGALAVAKKPSHYPVVTLLLRGLRETSALVYVGCFTIFATSCVIIIVYVAHWRKMEMSHKTRHVVVNLNLSLALLASMFALGVKMHRLQIACRISTILLHYLSISTQIWITIINFKLLYKLIKSHLEEPYDLDKQNQKVKPVAPDYLLGWGVPAIVCGIGSAINWDNQSPSGMKEESKICFLNKSATILMLFLPSAIIVLINFVIFIKIVHFSRRGCYYPGDEEDDDVERQNSLKCGSHLSISSSSSTSSYPPISSRLHPERSNSDDTMVVDDENDAKASKKMSDTNRRLLQLLTKSVVGVSSGNASSFVHEVTEKSLLPLDGFDSPLTSDPKVEFDGFGTIYPSSSQLCGSAATLLLYCATWATGMLSVIGDPPRVFSGGFNGDFFRIIFLALSLALSSFMIVYFCFGRRDIRKAVCGSRWRQRRQSFATSASREEVWHLRDSIIEQRKATDYHHPVFCKPDPSTTSVEVELLGMNDEIRKSRDARKSTSPSETARSDETRGPSKIKDEENLAVKNSVVVDSKSSIVFYDPRQNGAAKRYWEKARKKRNKTQTCNDDAGRDDACFKSQEIDFQKHSCKPDSSGRYQHHPTSTEHLISLEKNCHGNNFDAGNLQCFFNDSILSERMSMPNAVKCDDDEDEEDNDDDDDDDDDCGDCEQNYRDREISLREFGNASFANFCGTGSHNNNNSNNNNNDDDEEEYDDVGNDNDDDEDDDRYKTDDNDNINEICHPSNSRNNNNNHHQHYFPQVNYHNNNHHHHDCGFCQCCHTNHPFDHFPPHHEQSAREYQRCVDQSRPQSFYYGNQDALNGDRSSRSVQYHPQCDQHGNVCLDYRNDVWVKK